MLEIKNWFEGHKHEKVYNCGEYEFIIQMGFKITHYFEPEKYTIQDCRHCDFYKSVSEDDMNIIRDNGFVRGTSIIRHNKNVIRVQHYLNRIKELYEKRKISQRSDETKEQYTKRIKNYNLNIGELNTTMQFYRLLVEQFENRKLN